MSSLTITTSLLTLFFFALSAFAADTPSNTSTNTDPPTIPQGNTGIASQFPGDSNINSHPAVVATEDFETEDTIEDLRRNHFWTSISNKDDNAIKFDSVIPPNSLGTRSIKVTAIRGENAGGHLFAAIPKGYDQLHARFYVRFAEDAGYTHHFSGLGATDDPQPWPVGRAGLLPDGSNKFNTGIEPAAANGTIPPPGYWNFYSYWHEMRSFENADGSTNTPPAGTGTSFYGNSFTMPDEQKAFIPRGKWICVELMMKANSAPDKYDGEQAFWIDGKLIQWLRNGAPLGTWMRDTFHTFGYWNKTPIPFEGFNWRNTNDLKLNKFTLSLYVSDNVFNRTEEWAKNHPDIKINLQQLSVNFDHVVLATQYIGPIQSK